MKSWQKKILFIFNALSRCLKLYKIIFIGLFSVFIYICSFLFCFIACDVVFYFAESCLFYER
ncbi:hypothetical protein CSU32_02270 [Salmonella enterica subsp. diarizonae]|uniref:Uncharacterized protein n=4 Tax=Salmonella enterica TaxID=28901 RepID=A0A7Z0Y7R3_SALDZ|nr:hypothetical protein [Salmonella enterica subsp. diarizonae]EAM2981338.1 hypothetical protein [Salmonella enterica]EAW1160937.1 hypothetical protein [Salmonella enterica subsp. enterica]ECF6855351.1 hypothetical protein [Salmonella enterica subsp. arizonae]ECS6415668.1 hypothetical protein [Salmonella enterica subsp. diarizonae serovar 50:r:z]ECS6773023.1 hypothetical protein [Salmonella enterica subsp. diarizonae serovar 65:z10:e,n,x,z15]OSE55063.1 hypothetical protein R530_00345 [Salmone